VWYFQGTYTTVNSFGAIGSKGADIKRPSLKRREVELSIYFHWIGICYWGFICSYRNFGSELRSYIYVETACCCHVITDDFCIKRSQQGGAKGYIAYPYLGWFWCDKLPSTGKDFSDISFALFIFIKRYLDDR
jgi:hypothetical protein